jgi:hypothetical protein
MTNAATVVDREQAMLDVVKPGYGDAGYRFQWATSQFLTRVRSQSALSRDTQFLGVGLH